MRKLALLVASASLITGCSQGTPGLRPLTYASPGEAQLFISSEPCVHTPGGHEAFQLIPLIAATAISGLLDKFGTALEKGAEGGDLPTVTAMQNLSLRPGTIPNCITMMRGAFVPETGATTVIPIEGLIYNPNDPEQKRRYHALAVPPIYRLDQYIELELRGAPNNQALTFFPRFALINRSLDGDGAGNRVLSIALKFSSPGIEDAGSVTLLSDMHIGSAFQATTYAGGRANAETPWFAFPNKESKESEKDDKSDEGKGAEGKKTGKKPPTAEAGGHTAAAAAPTGITGGAGLGAATPITQPPATVTVDPYSTDPTAVPMTVTVTTVETRPTNEALAFIASIFNGVKPKVEEQIGKKLNPSEK
jgi:hypothetical protein